MESKLDADSYFWFKKWFGGGGVISDNMTQKPIFYVAFGQTPPRNKVVMATPKVPGDRKLLEKECYI